MLVRDLPPDERPMERLARLGPQPLKNTELLAILFGGQTGLEAAAAALRDGLENLHKQLKNASLSETRRARIGALLELSRRLEVAAVQPERFVDRGSQIGPYLVAQYAHEPQERIGLVLLDGGHRVIAERVVYIGQHDASYASPRWLLKHAVDENARAIILFHNHPSGDPTPSPNDVAFTDRLKKACEMLDVELLDHVVIGRRRYYSFQDHNRL
jgi:DNA repair protein RadC